MRNTRIAVAAGSALLALALATSLPAFAADTAAGKKTFDAICADCHELKDYAGKPAAGLEASLKAIVAGQKKHKKKLALGDAEIANVAAYLSSATAK
jgi:mono/diheme cytochrome c family protein